MKPPTPTRASLKSNPKYFLGKLSPYEAVVLSPRFLIRFKMLVNLAAFNLATASLNLASSIPPSLPTFVFSILSLASSLLSFSKLRIAYTIPRSNPTSQKKLALYKVFAIS